MVIDRIEKNKSGVFGPCYVCPNCFSLYEYEEEAVKCYESHSSIETEYVWSLGEEFPEVVYLHKKEGDKKVKTGKYEFKEMYDR